MHVIPIYQYQPHPSPPSPHTHAKYAWDCHQLPLPLKLVSSLRKSKHEGRSFFLEKREEKKPR